MLREVFREFDIDNGVSVKPGDIVDATNWRNRAALEAAGKIGPTQALKPTVDIHTEPEVSTPSDSTNSSASKLKKSALASRQRVFTRKAKHGE